MKLGSNRTVNGLFVGLFFLLSATAHAADGKTLYTQLTCAACHGKEGRGVVYKRDRKDRKTGKIKARKGDPKPGFEAYPKLAGQNSLYLYNQMMDIFSGKRKNGMSAAMAGIKLMIDQSATDADLKAIATYLSKVK